MARWWCVVALAAASALPWSARSAAQNVDKEAKAVYQKGVADFDAGRFDDAAAAFRKAYELKPSWKIRYNIGQSEAAAKRYDLALDAFEAYLAEGGDDVPDDRREEVLSELRRLREMVGDLKVKGRDGLDVEVDGVARGRTPLPGPLSISAGVMHSVRLLDGGKEIMATRVQVRGGGTAEVEAEPPRPVDQPSPAKPLPVPEPPRPEQPAAERGLSQVYFWVALGATAALGAGTVGMGVAADSKVSDVKDSPSDRGLRDDAKAMQAGAYALLALTGAAAVTTAVLAVFTDFGGGEAGEGASVSVTPTVGGLALEGRF
jgi:hypothetical protein